MGELGRRCGGQANTGSSGKRRFQTLAANWDEADCESTSFRRHNVGSGLAVCPGLAVLEQRAENLTTLAAGREATTGAGQVLRPLTPLISTPLRFLGGVVGGFIPWSGQGRCIRGDDHGKQDLVAERRHVTAWLVAERRHVTAWDASPRIRQPPPLQVAKRRHEEEAETPFRIQTIDGAKHMSTRHGMLVRVRCVSRRSSPDIIHVVASRLGGAA